MKPSIALQILMVAIAVGGCAPDSEWVAPPDVPAENTAGQWKADYDRLVDDIPRTAKSLGWAILHVREYDTDGNKRIHAEALLPNERIAVIDGWPGDNGRIHITIRVGTAGDAAREQQFLDALRRTLSTKPDADG